ncbi:MAG TPA: hypothetical protein VK435_06980 [Thermodesulfovibrionales bacterium]|nr:hypothetical protein [Thermodesulfovibrionales bacterium]
MVELGQIDKPEAASFAGKRKLYCVASIFSVTDAPDDYTELVAKYWDEVSQQLEKIEAAGKIRKIFSEIILEQGDEALEILGKINDKVPQIIKKRLEAGGTLIPLENSEFLGPYTDWSNCLRVIYTRDVFMKVLEFYNEVSEKRLRHIQETIEKNLLEDEAGLLLLKDEDRIKLQFPKDIEVFLITPPSYDDIMRWLRDKMTRKEKGKE